MRLFAARWVNPPRRSAARLRFIVVEEGAREIDLRAPSADGERPEDGGQRSDDGEEVVAVSQTNGEIPASLALAVAKRIAAFERSDRRIEQAVIGVGSGLGPQVTAARGLIARALLAHMVAVGFGELVLAAENAEPDTRQELLSLVETLLGEHEQRNVTIRLRFRDDATRLVHASGIHPVPRPVDTRLGMAEGRRS